MASKWLRMPPIRRGLLTSAARERRARRAVEEGWVARAEAAADQPGDAGLIISLTSHAPRFGTLALTLKSLLLQSLRPARVVLWIGRRDVALLPAEVRELAPFGLDIRACEDLG